MTIPQTAALLATVLFPAAMIYAGIMDVLTMKIRNILVAGVGLLFFVLAPLAGVPLAGIALNLGIAAIVFFATFAFFTAGWIGGGDAKLATAVALWFGWDHSLAYFMYASIAGGALTLAILAFRKTALPLSWYRSEAITRLHDAKTGIPYGAAFAFAALIVFPTTDWYALAV